MIEFDEGYFEVETSEKEQENWKRDRGSQKQMNVAVITESVPLEDIKTGKKSQNLVVILKLKFYKATILEK